MHTDYNHYSSVFRSYLSGLSALILLSLFAQPVAANLNVVVSIKPLQLIAEEILGDRGTVEVLIPPTDSPHHFNMTPSQRRSIEAADLVVYIGVELEVELHEALNDIELGGKQIALLESRQITRRDLRGDLIDLADRRTTVDPHIWLDPANGAAIALEISKLLQELDPLSADNYEDNLQRFNSSIASLEELTDSYSTLPQLPYVVYHNGISYFEAQLGRRHALALVESTETAPSMRHILRVRAEIARINPACVLIDNAARERTLDTLLSGQETQRIELDLLGVRLGAGARYSELATNLFDDFASCFEDFGN